MTKVFSKKLRPSARLYAALRAVIALCALTALVPSARAASTPEVVRIAVMSASGYAGGSQDLLASFPSERVIQEGWLAAQLRARGVRLEWVPIAGEIGPITNEDFASGRIDFANIGDLPSIILNARSTHTELIVPCGKGSDLFLVVPRNSTAKSIRDLKGKRVNVQLSRPWELGFRMLARANGLSFADFRNFNLTPQVGISALALGNIDAIFGTTGYLLEDRGVGKIIWSSRGSLQYKVRGSELWGTRDFIDRYPDITQLIATAYVRAQYWVSQESSREAAIHEATLNGTPESVVRLNYSDPILAWRDYWSPLFDGLVTNHYRQAAQFAFAARIIDKPLDADELLQTRFVARALADLKLGGFWTPSPAAAFPPIKQAQLSTITR